MAGALATHRNLDAVHIVAHGAPGRIAFASGDWSAETPAEHTADFAAIGRALGARGGLRLWSCFAGAGPDGRALVARLTEATGASVTAADGLIGAAALGG